MTDGRRERGARTRAKLIDAALDLIALEGVPAVTQRRVAAAAGTSLASTTYHFRTAEDLLVAAFEEATRRSEAAFERRRAAVFAGELSLLDAAMDFAEQSLANERQRSDASLELIMSATRVQRLRPVSRAHVERMAALLSPFTASQEAGGTVARSLTGLIIHELERGEPRPSAELRRDVEQLFDAFGITRAVQHAAHIPTKEDTP